jgi:hypothetical protein
LKPQVDDAGYDLVLEANGVVRHVPLKSSHAGSSSGEVSGEQWAKDDSRRNDFVFLLNQLMGSHLWHCTTRILNVGLKFSETSGKVGRLSGAICSAWV